GARPAQGALRRRGRRAPRGRRAARPGHRRPRREHLAQGMSESDEKNELSKRPWDPAGTQPKHDPASLLPESSEPLLPPDADVVESDAIDEEPDGDLLPERHRAAGAPATAAAGPSEYAPRFQFMTGALVAVGVAAILGIAVAVVGISPGG